MSQARDTQKLRQVTQCLITILLNPHPLPPNMTSSSVQPLPAPNDFDEEMIDGETTDKETTDKETTDEEETTGQKTDDETIDAGTVDKDMVDKIIRQAAANSGKSKSNCASAIIAHPDSYLSDSNDLELSNSFKAVWKRAEENWQDFTPKWRGTTNAQCDSLLNPLSPYPGTGSLSAVFVRKYYATMFDRVWKRAMTSGRVSGVTG